MGGEAAATEELEGAGPGGLERRRGSAAPLEGGQGPRQLGLVGVGVAGRILTDSRRRREGGVDVLSGPQPGARARAMRSLPQPDRRRLSAAKARAKAASSSSPSAVSRSRTERDLVGGVTLVEQPAAQLGSRARAMAEQAVGVGQHARGRCLGAQRLDLGRAELPAGEEMMARDQRLGDGAHELAVDVQGDAPPLGRA